MSEFSEPPPLPSEEILRPRIDVLASRTMPLALDIWREVGGGFVFVDARFKILDSQVSRAGWALYDLDRESRRAARLIAGRGVPAVTPTETPPEAVQELAAAREATPRELLRPSAIQSAGFTLVRAEPGSADFLLDAYGLLNTILLSNPIQFLLTLQAILGLPTQVILRRWPRGRTQPPEVRQLDEELYFEGGALMFL